MIHLNNIKQVLNGIKQLMVFLTFEWIISVGTADAIVRASIVR